MRKVVVVLGLIVVGVIAGGFYLGWWQLTTSPPDEQGRSQVSLTVDPKEMKEDLQGARDKAGEFQGKLQTGPETKSVKGTVSRIDAAGRVLTVTTDNREEIKVQLTDDTKVHLGDKAGTPADLKSGDAVAVTYEPKKGEREEMRATQVTVAPKK
jgi:hypothetical protein